jgi:hypothetical protein
MPDCCTGSRRIMTLDRGKQVVAGLGECRPAMADLPRNSQDAPQ